MNQRNPMYVMREQREAARPGGRRVRRSQIRTAVHPKEMPIAEVAGRIQRSEAAVRQLVWRKRIPHRKPGGRIVFLRDEIEEWLQTEGGVTLAQVLKKSKR